MGRLSGKTALVTAAGSTEVSAPLTRHVLLLDLKHDPDLIARYRQWHAPGAVPAAVVRAIRVAGVEAMEIHLSGDRLVMIMEVSPAFSPQAKVAADAADPDVQAWEALMDNFQKPLPWAVVGEKWTAAERIFALAEQLQTDDPE